MTTGSYEDHTATTGPGDPEKAPTSYLGKVAASLNGPGARGRGALPQRPARGPVAPHAGVARQRVLEHRRARPRHRPPHCPQWERPVRGARHVQLLLPDPPVHARHGHRPVRRAATIVAAAALGACSPPAASAATREFWVAAVPATCNIVPNRRDAIHGMRYAPARPSFPPSSTGATRAAGASRCPTRRAGSGNQDLVPGPLLRARAGDRLLVHFKNLDRLYRGRTRCTSTASTTAELRRRLRARASPGVTATSSPVRPGPTSCGPGATRRACGPTTTTRPRWRTRSRAGCTGCSRSSARTSARRTASSRSSSRRPASSRRSTGARSSATRRSSPPRSARPSSGT